MSHPIPIYVFRSVEFAKNETTVTAAPLGLVVSIYGAAGLRGEQGSKRLLVAPSTIATMPPTRYFWPCGELGTGRDFAEYLRGAGNRAAHRLRPPLASSFTTVPQD